MTESGLSVSVALAEHESLVLGLSSVATEPTLPRVAPHVREGRWARARDGGWVPDADSTRRAISRRPCSRQQEFGYNSPTTAGIVNTLRPWPPFEHHVSIVDLLFCTGPDATPLHEGPVTP